MTNGNGLDWDGLVRSASRDVAAPRQATRHDGGLGSASKPQRFICDNREAELFAVKFRQNGHGDGRAIFNEQVVGLAGRLIDAPVAEVVLVDVSQPLVDALRQDASLGLDFVPEAGVHHGSRWASLNCSDRSGVAYEPENRERFAALDVLYTWIPCSGDHQLIYNNDPPHEVYSVDHTPFFRDGPNWTEASLTADVANVHLDPFFSGLALTPDERADAVARLQAVTPEEIAAVVAQPHDTWGVSASERSAVASYLYERRGGVAATCA